MDKKVLIMIIAVLAVVIIAAAAMSGGGSENEKEEPKDVPVTGISLNKTSLALVAGDVETLKATLAPSGATGVVAWSTSNDSVVTVFSGVVTAVSQGTATITATCGDHKATCDVVVERAATAGERNALSKAKDLLDSTILFYSEAGIKRSLVNTYKFTESEAEYAIAHCGGDWQKQADKQAARYLLQHIGPEGLVRQLTMFHDFPEDQARKAVENLGDVNWDQQAIERAKLLMEERSSSKASALDSLIRDGYTQQQAQSAVDHIYG